jgi:hypothetical protein
VQQRKPNLYPLKRFHKVIEYVKEDIVGKRVNCHPAQAYIAHQSEIFAEHSLTVRRTLISLALGGQLLSLAMFQCSILFH